LCGLRFPEKKTRTIGNSSNFWFGIGMSVQVSDVAVMEKRIRRIVMFHSIIAFFFNVTLLALTMNLVGDAIQNG
jgi:uncharacterized membrane protein